ncbi:Co/Zn/Cd efflux system component [Pelomonas saccharophila]|uniref:Co/Zn/Cd efflux system component n=1 Tax=Roseateles saccharophilus TaxID=304 RepID=A0ABU1YPA6_ROSSA|nr:cation transporter [Roseateles saccharophilus]MDR7270021.1 Co/Zn/Cd efflux system component [Roseateles saccharophilus]
MSHACHDHDHSHHGNSPAYRRVLWVALVLNAAMAVVELTAGSLAGSLALWADSADFIADAANYAISLAVLASSLTLRARVAWVKGAAMGLIGAAVLARAAWASFHGEPPQAFTMGAVGVAALAANVIVALMLYAWREGDANMRAVWLCSRNDALGNIAVVAAAAAVAWTGTAWPDLAVAAVMAVLALSSARVVMRHASDELRTAAAPAP